MPPSCLVTVPPIPPHHWVLPIPPTSGRRHLAFFSAPLTELQSAALITVASWIEYLFSSLTVPHLADLTLSNKRTENIENIHVTKVIIVARFIGHNICKC